MGTMSCFQSRVHVKSHRIMTSILFFWRFYCLMRLRELLQAQSRLVETKIIE
jgi:hypothetical protein